MMVATITVMYCDPSFLGKYTLCDIRCKAVSCIVPVAGKVVTQLPSQFLHNLRILRHLDEIFVLSPARVPCQARSREAS